MSRRTSDYFQNRPTDQQKEVINFFVENQISILTGDPGTGKTFMSLYYALKQVHGGEFDKVVITKPPVETGKGIGFLKGTEEDKLAPYKQSYVDVVEKLLGKEVAAGVIKTKIVFEPIGFCRGRTYENSVVILDEAQNCELAELMSFATRLHETSKLIVLGDQFQADIKKSGLLDFQGLCKGIEGIGIRDLDDSFQMRNAIITELYANYKRFLLDKNNVSTVKGSK
jgi:phosphate starvation-inducible protein PhoH and related proteins